MKKRHPLKQAFQVWMELSVGDIAILAFKQRSRNSNASPAQKLDYFVGRQVLSPVCLLEGGSKKRSKNRSGPNALIRGTLLPCRAPKGSSGLALGVHPPDSIPPRTEERGEALYAASGAAKARHPKGRSNRDFYEVMFHRLFDNIFL